MRPSSRCSRRADAGAALAAALAAALIAGCGSGSSDDGPRNRGEFGAGPNRPTPVRQFTCQDWNRANDQVRRQTIVKIRHFAGGAITGEGVRAGSRGAVLDDDDAFRLFETYCRQRHARHFVLYKLYTHAAAFAGHR